MIIDIFIGETFYHTMRVPDKKTEDEIREYVEERLPSLKKRDYKIMV
jgi:hypothetical protein